MTSPRFALITIAVAISGTPSVAQVVQIPIRPIHRAQKVDCQTLESKSQVKGETLSSEQSRQLERCQLRKKASDIDADPQQFQIKDTKPAPDLEPSPVSAGG